MTQVQSKLLNVRLSPQLYNLFKQKINRYGITPSSFIRHAIISFTIPEQVHSNTLASQFQDLVQSLPEPTLSEDEALDLINKERQAAYP